MHLTALVFRHRRSIIAVFLAITVFFAWWIKDLKINSDMVSYLPKDDPAVQLFHHIGERFGQNDLVLAAVESDDVFTPRTIRDIALLTDRFAGVEGVTGVISLTNVIDIRRASDGGIEIGRLVDPDALPATDEEVQALRASVMGRERYRGAIVSEDGRATLIICRTKSGADTVAMVHRIQAAAASSGIEGKLLFGGNPLLVTELGAIIFHDLRILVPIVAILIILTLFFAFGTLRGVLIPLSAVGMSTIWVLGLLGLLRVPLTLISDIIPALLVAIGTAPCIHILSKFDEDVSRYGSRGEESLGAFREVGTRVILAALTIVLGFSSFIVGSYLTAIRDFGIFSSIGVLFSLLISIMFVPALVASIRVVPRTGKGGSSVLRRGRGSAAEKALARWAGMIVHHPKAIIAASAVILALGIAGTPFIRRDVDFTSFAGPKSVLRATEALLNKEFGGSRPLQVVFTGDMGDPIVLKEMLRFQRFITAQGIAKNATSVADIIAEMNGIVDGEKIIPDDRARVANLMFMIEGQDIVAGLMSDDKREGQIQGMVGTLDTAQLQRMIATLDEYIREMPARGGLSVSYTGMPLISWHLDQSILLSQGESLLIALVFIFLLLAIKLRSWRGGLMGLAPIVLAIALMFGFMGLTAIPINVATVLVGCIALGIGIDYSIHFSVRFSTYYSGPSTAAQAIAKTIQTTGKAIIINVLAVTMGFIALLFADLVPLRQFGLLTAIAMIGSGLGALTLLPALILRAPAAFIGTQEQQLRQQGGTS